MGVLCLAGGVGDVFQGRELAVVVAMAAVMAVAVVAAVVVDSQVVAMAAVMAVAVIHLGGMAWLSVIAGRDVAFATGVAPFLAGDVLKILLVLVIGTALGGRFRKLFG